MEDSEASYGPPPFDRNADDRVELGDPSVLQSYDKSSTLQWTCMITIRRSVEIHCEMVNKYNCYDRNSARDLTIRRLSHTVKVLRVVPPVNISRKVLAAIFADRPDGQSKAG